MWNSQNLEADLVLGGFVVFHLNAILAKILQMFIRSSEADQFTLEELQEIKDQIEQYGVDLT